MDPAGRLRGIGPAVLPDGVRRKRCDVTEVPESYLGTVVQGALMALGRCGSQVQSAPGLIEQIDCLEDSVSWSDGPKVVSPAVVGYLVGSGLKVVRICISGGGSRVVRATLRANADALREGGPDRAP
jgi:hypothetical protein